MNNSLHFSSKSSEWSTPQDLFDRLDLEYLFQIDVCASTENHKCDTYFTKEVDGLSVPWLGFTCWMNPPYGRTIGKWIEKASHESKNGALVVALLPARTDTRWFHQFIYNQSTVSIEFLKGRLKFGDSKNSAPFPSMIVVFNPVPQGDPHPIEDNMFMAIPLMYGRGEYKSD